jgi:hypothetical protein
MKSKTLLRGDWSPSQIDLFTKETQIGQDQNEWSALLGILMTRARKLVRANRLDSELFGQDIKQCLEYLKDKKLDLLQSKLSLISEKLKRRSIISSILELPDKDSFETTSLTFNNYSRLISKFKRFNHNSQEEIMEDLTRDLSALKMYIDRSSPQTIRQPNIKKSLLAMALKETHEWQAQYSIPSKKYAGAQLFRYSHEYANRLGRQYVIIK